MIQALPPIATSPDSNLLITTQGKKGVLLAEMRESALTRLKTQA